MVLWGWVWYLLLLLLVGVLGCVIVLGLVVIVSFTGILEREIRDEQNKNNQD